MLISNQQFNISSLTLRVFCFEVWLKIYKNKDGLLIGTILVVFTRKGVGWLARVIAFRETFFVWQNYSSAKKIRTKMSNEKIQKDLDRIKSLKFHCKHNDYFGTLATILDLVRQEYDKKFQNLRDDLMYLHTSVPLKTD